MEIRSDSTWGLMRTCETTRISEKFMMHAKLFYLEMDDRYDVLYVGSYNLTKAALSGENYEAGVRIQANRKSGFMIEARSYINKIWDEAVTYNPDKAELYAWTFNLSVKDLVDLRIVEKLYEKLYIQHSPTIILAAVDRKRIPLSEGDIIDVDIGSFPSDLKEWIGDKLHVYLVDSIKYLSPILQNMARKASRLLICTITGKISTSKSKLGGSAAKPSERYRGAIRYGDDRGTFYLMSPDAIKGEELGIKGENQLQVRIKKVITNQEEISRYCHRYIRQRPEVEQLIEFERKRADKPSIILVGDPRIRERPIIPIVRESIGYLNRHDPYKMRTLLYVWKSEYIYFKIESENGEERYNSFIKPLTEYL